MGQETAWQGRKRHVARLLVTAVCWTGLASWDGEETRGALRAPRTLGHGNCPANANLHVAITAASSLPPGGGHGGAAAPKRVMANRAGVWSRGGPHGSSLAHCCTSHASVSPSAGRGLKLLAKTGSHQPQLCIDPGTSCSSSSSLHESAFWASVSPHATQSSGTSLLAPSSF